MPDVTAIYYTGHREVPAFEEKIRRTLLDTLGDTPLISVSQRPLDFGHNICVGDVGQSAHNAWRQLQIGAEAATTKFVCAAEADYLYPPDYFTFSPPRDDTFYLPSPMYILFAQTGRTHPFALKPKGQEGAMVVNRELLLRRLWRMFADLPQWRDREPGTGRDPKRLHLFGKHPRERFETKVATITFKTDNNLHQATQYSRRSETMELPYWGVSTDLLEKYLEA